MNWKPLNIEATQLNQRVLIIDDNKASTDPIVRIARWTGIMDGGKRVWLLDGEHQAVAGIVTHWMPIEWLLDLPML